MSARGYWVLTGLWVLAALGLWGAWFSQRSAVEATRAAQRQLAGQALADLQAIRPSGTSEHPVDAARLKAHVVALSTPRVTDAERKKARQHIAHALISAGYKSDLLSFKAGMNVVAERPGTDPNAGAILVGAHFDTVAGSPGADDNASGVAAVLEVARVLKNVPTRRTLRVVFFDAEERGLLGSKAYAASPTRITNLHGALILEMLGYRCTAPDCQQVAPGTPPGLTPKTGEFLAAVGDLQHLELLRALRRARGTLPLIALPVPLHGNELPDSRRSDHVSFWDQGVGAVMVTDTGNLRNPHYHQVSDTPETLDWGYLAASTQVVVDATVELLGAE